MMLENRFIKLVSRKLAGEASAEELAELRDLLLQPEYAQRYKQLEKFWQDEPRYTDSSTEDALRRLSERLNFPYVAPLPSIHTPVKDKVIPSWVSTLAIAASVIGLLLFTRVWLEDSSANTSEAMARVEKKQNAKGVRSTIELPDGSKIWLNADSYVEYPTSFSGNTREVKLHGEAFFDVVKNPERPFVIHLENGTVRVLGTSFNVRAYDNEKIVETSVSTGKVAFIPKYTLGKQRDTLFITPNKKISYFVEEGKVSVKATLAEEDKAWTEGRLVFNAKPLREIAVELERSFGKRIVFRDEKSAEFVFTGSFQNNSLDEIMYFLSLSKTDKIYYKITGDELLISTRQEDL